MEKSITVWFDPEADFLEVSLNYKTSTTSPSQRQSDRAIQRSPHPAAFTRIEE